MLERELEIIGAGALGGLLRRKAKHAPEPGTLCANCGAELKGFYCHNCGQTADNHHRSILHLMWEGIEGLTHLDGRLGQTLPPLFLNPGKLARDHFEGRRQRHVPPFRLFLISLLIFMFALESLFHAGEQKKITTHGQTVSIQGAKDGTTNVVVLTPRQAASGIHFNAGLPKDGKLASVTVEGKPVSADDSAAIDKALGEEKTDKDDKVGGWLKPRLKRAIENKEYYLMVLFTWAHRLAILLLPILAGLLALVYVRRKQYFIYDHLIVSMQFLSFVFLISAIAWLMPGPLQEIAVLIASIWAPINLYQTLRGAYGSRWWTSVIKTAFLWISTLTLFGVLMLGLMTLALAEMA